jgi:hypothetical protein
MVMHMTGLLAAAGCSFAAAPEWECLLCEQLEESNSANCADCHCWSPGVVTVMDTYWLRWTAGARRLHSFGGIVVLSALCVRELLALNGAVELVALNASSSLKQ